MRLYRSPLGFLAAGLIASACISGCVELKYYADNRLDDSVAIKSSRVLKSLYASFTCLPGCDKRFVEDFSISMAKAFESKGYEIALPGAEVDLVLNGRLRLYKKQRGNFFFILFIPIYRFSETYDGIELKVTFKTDKGSWRKTYRAYYRGWLESDQAQAADLIIRSILRDISPAG